MARDEKQTRIELINPALHESGWTDALIREERSPGGTDISDGKLKNQSKAIEALPGALLREVFDFEVVQED